MKLLMGTLSSRMIAVFRIFILSALLAAFNTVLAATEVELYVEQAVVSQDAPQKEQNEAISEAFRRLLVRVTGITQVLDYPVIDEAVSEGGKYLATFRFEKSDEFFTNVLGEKVATKKMIMQFDKKSVDTLLVQNRMPVWGAKRPDVLIWLADRLDGQDHILADAEDTELASQVAKQTNERGIPYLLPIMDLTDSLNLSFSEVYGLFSTDIEEASIRYSPEAVLAGRVLKGDTEGEFVADWLMLFKGERIRLPSMTGSLDFVVAQGIDLVAQRLSEQYALILDPLLLGNLSVQVLDIRGINEFARLESYLNSINIITKATVNTFEGNNITFNVEISGDQSQLADVLALDGQLIPMAEETLEAQLDNTLVFQWNAN